MNVKYYPLLTALIMALCYVSFCNGCDWEAPVEVGEPGLGTLEEQTRQPPELVPAPEVMVVDCDTFEDGQYWAEAYYPGLTWQELATVVAVAHHAGSYYPSPGYDFEQRPARLQDGKVIVSCIGGVDYVAFMYAS